MVAVVRDVCEANVCHSGSYFIMNFLLALSRKGKNKCIRLWHFDSVCEELKVKKYDNTYKTFVFFVTSVLNLFCFVWFCQNCFVRIVLLELFCQLCLGFVLILFL